MKKLITITAILLSSVCYAQSSIKTESDTTIIGSSKWYGETITIRYFFLKENYLKAFHYVQLANIPYEGLNNNAKDEFWALRKYITRIQVVVNKIKK